MANRLLLRIIQMISTSNEVLNVNGAGLYEVRRLRLRHFTRPVSIFHPGMHLRVEGEEIARLIDACLLNHVHIRTLVGTIHWRLLVWDGVVYVGQWLARHIIIDVH